MNRLNSLLIVPDGELQVTRDSTLLLVVASGVACEFEDLGDKVLVVLLENSGEVALKSDRVSRT